MSSTDGPAAAPQHLRRPLLTWVLRAGVVAAWSASVAALAVGWTAGLRQVSNPAAIGLGLATLAGWAIDGIEARRGVAKKGLSGLPTAARVGLWILVTALFAVLLVVVGALVGAGIGLWKGEDWLATAGEGVRRGALLGGGLLGVGMVVLGAPWLVEQVAGPAPKGPNGRWVTIDAWAHAAGGIAAAAGGVAASLLTVAARHESVWMRPAGLVLAAAAVAVALAALHRATRPGGFRIERLRGDEATPGS